MSLDNILLIPGLGGQLLLDAYPGAVAGYSLRKIRKAYSGSCVRVRRDSDNAEQNIGFVNNILDTSGLSSFCSGANGFVTTWYDQVALNNATQATTTAQPKIFDSATGVVSVDSRPVVDFDNTDDFLGCASFWTSGSLSAFVASVCYEGSGNTSTVTFSNNLASNSSIGIGARANSASSFIFSGTFIDITAGSVAANNRLLTSGIFTQSGGTTSNSTQLNNGATNTGSNANPSGINRFSIGALIRTASVFYRSSFHEIVFYNSDMTTKRAAINSNILSYWGIT